MLCNFRFIFPFTFCSLQKEIAEERKRLDKLRLQQELEFRLKTTPKPPLTFQPSPSSQRRQETASAPPLRHHGQSTVNHELDLISFPEVVSGRSDQNGYPSILSFDPLRVEKDAYLPA